MSLVLQRLMLWVKGKTPAKMSWAEDRLTCTADALLVGFKVCLWQRSHHRYSVTTGEYSTEDNLRFLCETNDMPAQRVWLLVVSYVRKTMGVLPNQDPITSNSKSKRLCKMVMERHYCSSKLWQWSSQKNIGLCLVILWVNSWLSKLLWNNTGTAILPVELSNVSIWETHAVPYAMLWSFRFNRHLKNDTSGSVYDSVAAKIYWNNVSSCSNKAIVRSTKKWDSTHRTSVILQDL